MTLLDASFQGELGAVTAREWADDMLTQGVSSDALIEMSLLADHEWDRAGELLHGALNGAGIVTQPSWQLASMFFRLLIHNYLVRRMGVEEFSLRFEQAFNFGPSVEGAPEGAWAALSDVFEAAVVYSPCERERAEYPAYTGDDEIRQVAQAAASRLAL